MPDDYDFDHLPINRRDRARMARDARRQERRREGMRSRHAPDTHAVDRAISRAVARLASRTLRDRRAIAELTINYLAIAREAVDVLCLRYNRAEARRAVPERIKARRQHLEALPPERN